MTEDGDECENLFAAVRQWDGVAMALERRLKKSGMKALTRQRLQHHLKHARKRQTHFTTKAWRCHERRGGAS